MSSVSKPGLRFSTALIEVAPRRQPLVFLSACRKASVVTAWFPGRRSVVNIEETRVYVQVRCELCQCRLVAGKTNAGRGPLLLGPRANAKLLKATCSKERAVDDRHD